MLIVLYQIMNLLYFYMQECITIKITILLIPTSYLTICDCESLIMRRIWPTRGCCAMVGGIDKLIEFIPLCLQKIFKISLI